MSDEVTFESDSGAGGRIVFRDHFPTGNDSTNYAVCTKCQKPTTPVRRYRGLPPLSDCCSAWLRIERGKD